MCEIIESLSLRPRFRPTYEYASHNGLLNVNVNVRNNIANETYKTGKTSHDKEKLGNE